jgi:peroxiredoxin
MKFSDQLNSLTADVFAKASNEYVSAVEATRKVIQDSSILGSAPRAGQVFPLFSLPNANGSIVSASELLKRGPLVVAFYRGGWCSFCNLELNALQLALPEINALGGSLVAISPQTPERSAETARLSQLSFHLLIDKRNLFARELGLVYRLPAAMQTDFQEKGLLLPEINGDDSWELPIPATYLVGQDGVIVDAFLDADFYHRKDPQELVEELRKLAH